MHDRSLLTVKERDLHEFFRSCGYKVPLNCPKCDFLNWDSGLTNPDRVSVELDGKLVERLMQGEAFDQFSMHLECSNCGYMERFNPKPFLRWLVDQNG